MRISYVLETHRNEDYVSGSLELQAGTGCRIYHGKSLPFKYGKSIVDGDTLKIGDMSVKALETPGHTMESMTYALYERGESQLIMAFTGDTVFPDSTGRIDLWGTNEQAAGMMYDSIHEKILPLGDRATLCPAHGPGSVCGTGIGDRDESTLGHERPSNPDLKLSRDGFIAKKAVEHLETPYYFGQMESYNLNGPPITGGPPSCGPLSMADFRAAAGYDVEFMGLLVPDALAGMLLSDKVTALD